jgi:hypothetical protein
VTRAEHRQRGYGRTTCVPSGGREVERVLRKLVVDGRLVEGEVVAISLRVEDDRASHLGRLGVDIEKHLLVRGRRAFRHAFENVAALELVRGRVEELQVERLRQVALSHEKRERRRVLRLLDGLLEQLAILLLVDLERLAVGHDSIAAVPVRPAHLARLAEHHPALRLSWCAGGLSLCRLG